MVMRAYAFLLLVAAWVGRATQSPACSWLHSSKVNLQRNQQRCLSAYSPDAVPCGSLSIGSQPGAINSAPYRLTARAQSLAARSLPAYSPGAVPCGSLSTGLQPGRSPLRLALYRLTARAQSLAARSLPAYSPGAVPCGSLSTTLCGFDPFAVLPQLTIWLQSLTAHSSRCTCTSRMP
jgi:hypothetical protein